MAYYVEYLLGFSKNVVTRKETNKPPKYGEIITIKNIKCQITNVKYDYEVWQFTGDYYYYVNIKAAYEI